MESWDRQLKSMLNENMSVMSPMVIGAQKPGQQSPVPQQDGEDGDMLSALKAILQNAGVDKPVNDKQTEPGSADPRNDVTAGQVFVPQLAMPRGMGMSVEGDVHTHDIDVEPQAPDEVQVTLAKDSEAADADMDGMKDIISRLLGGRSASAEGNSAAKLIVPYGDYAQEECGDELDSIKRLSGANGGAMSAGLGEDGDTFGHETTESSHQAAMEDMGDPEGTEAAAGHDDAINAALAQSYDANDDVNEESLDQPGTFEGDETGAQATSGDIQSLMTKLDSLLNMIGKDDTEAEVDVEVDAEETDDEDSEADTEDDESDDESEEEADDEGEEEAEEDLEEGTQSCNECGLYEAECKCSMSESRIFTKLLKMFEEAKPDFADIDDDGDEKETMKKAAKDKKASDKKKIDEWANSPQGKSADEQFTADIDFMTKIISGGLNNIKQDQTVVPSARVVTKAESNDVDTSMAAQIRKLAGLN